ncbi:hypothetical protein BGZ96_005455, partial [Linnemannia gamsii]
MLNMEDENQRSGMLIVFPEFGAVDGDGYAALIRANHFMDTVGYVSDLIKWLKDDNLHSKETRRFRRQMADLIPTRNPFTLSFRSFYRHGKDLALQRIVHFRRDEWLSEDHIDAILHTIEGKHGGGDAANFFVLPQTFVQGFILAALNPSIPREDWEPRRLKQALDLQDFVDASPKCEARALTVVNTGNHWAALVFDFKRKRMLFGDSMDKGKLNQEKHASIFAGARLLLESCYSHAPSSYGEGTTAKSDSSMRRIRAAFDGEPSHLPRAGLIKDGVARVPVANKDTGVTFKEQMCEGRDESSATDRATAHVPSHVVAKQDTPNDYTDGATEEIIVRPVKKEAIKQKSRLIASKIISKDASSSA